MDEKMLYMIPVTGDEVVEGSTNGTLSNPAGDAEDYKAKYEQILAKAEAEQKAREKIQTDLDRMKSSLQSQMASQKAQYEKQVQDLSGELRRIQTTGLDEEGLKKYQGEEAQRKVREYEEKIAQLQQQTQELSQMQTWKDYFVRELGLDPVKLVVDQGLAALCDSGWRAISEEVASLRKIASASKKESEDKGKDKDKGAEAPDVITKQGGKQTKGPTMTELIKRFGSREQVYEAFEQGEIRTLPTEE